jgi:hypothetical protein
MKYVYSPKAKADKDKLLAKRGTSFVFGRVIKSNPWIGLIIMALL